MPGGTLVLAEARTRPASARGISGAARRIVKEQGKRERGVEGRGRRGGRGGIFRGRAESIDIPTSIPPHLAGEMEWMHATPSSLSLSGGARLCPEKFRKRTRGEGWGGIRERARQRTAIRRRSRFFHGLSSESAMTLMTRGMLGVCRCAAGLHRKRTRACLRSGRRGRERGRVNA